MIDLHDPRVLAALNSATKYPSILTLHGLGEKGRLTDSILLPWWEEAGDLVLTEKVDGTNVRIIMLDKGDGGSWLIGSREELLTCEGDIVYNPAQGIVANTKHIARTLKASAGTQEGITVFYGELYGHKIGAASKEYTKDGQVGFRLFDIAFIDRKVLDWEPEAISTWREGSGQRFATEATLTCGAAANGLELTPRLGTIAQHELPKGHQAVQDWMKGLLPSTKVGLDVDGASEGIVLRTADRRFIAKARFQDYARTLRGAK